MSQAFLRIEIRAPDAASAERLLAEAYAAGATGCEERASEGSGTWLLLYVEEDRAAAVGRALRDAASAMALDSEIGAPEPVAARAWSEAWREGLAPVVVSSRLVVRAPFVSHVPLPGQETVQIEPAQAFGTGAHESTFLALRLLDRWLPRMGRGPCVLDVGTGSGVLAIAAARLGARRALGLDLDPVATRAARENAAANQVAGRVEVATGGVEALGAGGFDVVVANLLRRELAPILAALVSHVVPGGVGIFSGLIDADRAAVASGLAASGLEIVDEARRSDASGEVWIGLVARAPAR